MRYRMISVAVLIGVLVAGLSAADRHWQTGVWTGSDIQRQVLDFGPGASGFGAPNTAPAMRAMADVQTYVIETDDLRLEFQDVVRVGRRSLDVVVGAAVTFALDKKTIYVRDPAGVEHKLRVTKKVSKPKS
jgi:hypothetical protein